MTPQGNPPRRTRLLLLAGFGGLLLLMALAALDDIRALRSIQTRSDSLRNNFLERNRLLNQIRSGLYSSGTWVRDYVLSGSDSDASPDNRGLREAQRSISLALAGYKRVLTASEAGPVGELQADLSDYWNVLEPAAGWSPRQRTAAGYDFLRDQVYPRRAVLLAITDRIGALNEHQLNARILEVTALFSGLRRRVAITLLLTLGLGGLLATFSSRRVLTYERQASAHLSEIDLARQELKNLSTRLVDAQETERRSISRELHDEVGQSLSALLVTLGNITADVPEAARPALADHLGTVKAMAESSLRTVRNMALLLRPSMLDDLGLLPALQWQARELSRRSGLSVNVDATGLPEELPESYRTSIYRVVQEALHNCEQHAQATMARVTLRLHSDSLVLSVQDDGRGFDPDSSRGMGMLGMQERISNLGGTFDVESDTGRGTLIMVKLPLPA